MAGAFSIGDWRADPSLHSITGASGEVRLEPKVMQVLVELAEHPGQVVSKDRLLQTVWADTFVGDEVLARAISELRRIFSDDPKAPRFIQTIPKGGYRLIAPVAFARTPAAGVGSIAVAPSASARKRRFRRWMMASALLLLAVSIVAFTAWRGSEGAKPQRPGREIAYTQATFAGDVWGAALSLDGKTVAYLSGQSVFVRDLTSGQPLEIWKGGDADAVHWLPNGSQLLVGSEFDVWLVSRFGGTPRKVGGKGDIVAVSPDGSQLAQGRRSVVGFNLTSFDGTGTRRVRLQGSQLIDLDWNSPTNRISLLTVDDRGLHTVWSVTPEGRDIRRLYSDTEAIGAMCSSPIAGVLYLFRDRRGKQELVRVPLTGAQDPEVTVLGSGVLPSGYSLVPVWDCSVSADGEQLLFVRQFAHANIWRLDLGRAAAVATALTHGTSTLRHPIVSPDGLWIFASQEIGATRRIVRMPLTGGEFVEVASGADAVWSPDGKRLAFLTGAFYAPQHIWVSDVDGGAPQEVKGAITDERGVTWLPDGRLAWQTYDHRNYRIRDLTSGQEELLLKNPKAGAILDPIFSPRGNQVAMYWNRWDEPQPRRGLWVLSWPAREERFVAPNVAPIGWSPDGDWIYELEDAGAIVKVSVRTGRIEAVGKFPQGYLSFSSCSLTPDRQTIVCAPDESVTDAWIVEHFDSDVRERR
jgi:DNA-binding winged helix-turn-helix (wHTH) protein/Tol biopolymer transport system component